MALGAALGGAVGGTQGAVVGGVQGQAIAYHDAESQISSLALQQSEVQSDYTVNGYVFFPQGNYKGVQVVLLNQETHQTDTITVPWGGAPGELGDQYADSASAQPKRSAQTAEQPILPGATLHSSSDSELPPKGYIKSRCERRERYRVVAVCEFVGPDRPGLRLLRLPCFVRQPDVRPRSRHSVKKRSNSLPLSLF